MKVFLILFLIKLSSPYLIERYADVVCHFLGTSEIDIMPGRLHLSHQISLRKHVWRKCHILIKNVLENDGLLSTSASSSSVVALPSSSENNHLFDLYNSGLIFMNSHKELQNYSKIHIHQDIKLIDLQTLKVYECYSINEKVMENQLGLLKFDFQGLEYQETMDLHLIQRRANFQGYPLKAMTEVEPPFITLNMELAPLADEYYYNVTNVVQGMFYDLLLYMQKDLNFTTEILKRPHYEWGTVEQLANGTLATSGMIQSLVNGDAEMICARY